MLRRGYRGADLRADLAAGIVVGIVALPLSMALAIAIGAPPQHGLYTAIFAGSITALLGGSKFQVTGPTAAFVVILAPIVSKYGLTGLLTAGFMAGAMLFALGAARLGGLIRYIPLPVTMGFTTGIATVIATLQLKDVFGLEAGKLPESFTEKIQALWTARGTAHWGDVVIAALTMLLLLGVPRLIKRIPAPLVAISVAALTATALHHFVPSFDVATIGSRFHSTVDGKEIAGIPPILPHPALPWGSGVPTFALVRELLSPAIAIALLGAIESLLSAVIADGMTGTKHDSNAELVGLGVANMIAPIFGGIAATGALARTATNVRGGARSPIAAVIHAIVVLLAMLLLAPLVAYIPMASLAALLLLVAWNMSEVHRFVALARVSPKSDVFILLACFFLTVFFDMVVAVSVGFVASAILFMRRMASLTATRVQLDSLEEAGPTALPEHTALYEIHGPLFFGAAETAIATLNAIQHADVRTVIIHLGRVPTIDATGFAALTRAIESLERRGCGVVLAGPLPEPARIFDKANLTAKHKLLSIAPSLDQAVERARSLASIRPPA
ncbi:MAG: C4-dicarboxylic acid transporter DauA [Polyangiaceae bacterium]